MSLKTVYEDAKLVGRGLWAPLETAAGVRYRPRDYWKRRCSAVDFNHAPSEHEPPTEEGSVEEESGADQQPEKAPDEQPETGFSDEADGVGEAATNAMPEEGSESLDAEVTEPRPEPDDLQESADIDYFESECAEAAKAMTTWASQDDPVPISDVLDAVDTSHEEEGRDYGFPY